MHLSPIEEAKRKAATIPTGEPMKHFPTGAVRGTDCDDTRFDLISPIGLRRLAETYAEGAEKYGPDQWKKGLPASDLLNHSIAHIYKWLSGDRSEDHLPHAVWGLFAVMHFEECLPEMIDCGVGQQSEEGEVES